MEPYKYPGPGTYLMTAGTYLMAAESKRIKEGLQTLYLNVDF